MDRLWKKLVILGGNLVRHCGECRTTCVDLRDGQVFGQDLAGGPYHILSGYLSFPFAIAAMALFGKLLNIRPSH